MGADKTNKYGTVAVSEDDGVSINIISMIQKGTENENNYSEQSK